MEERLNAAGVPAARVRKLGEFLDEAEAGNRIGLKPAAFTQGKMTVRTPGLGWRFGSDGAAAGAGAPSLGSDNAALLAQLGIEPGNGS
jgi:crotonobetainyl-CoA:carnitine CoA-transferase CaiB-like acyl-CoA transferase